MDRKGWSWCLYGMIKMTDTVLLVDDDDDDDDDDEYNVKRRES